MRGSPQRSKIWGSISGGDRVARARCPRSSVEAGQNCVKTLKEQERATFFSPSENRCLLASTLKPEERVCCKRTWVMLKLDTLTKSCSPTMVITANGEVQTHEEATVYVKELDIFLTVKVLDNTPAVLSLGKLCDENGYSYEWINGQKPHLIKDGDSDNLQYGELRSYCGSRLVKFCPLDLPQLQRDLQVILLHLLHPHLLHLQ